MIECIYCGERKPETAFNREHVIPEAFGKFEQNFVLLKMVCTDCNTYFGNNLDNVLSRDSMEGLQRFESGLTPATPKHRLGRGRLKSSLRGTEFEGAKLEWRAAEDGSPGLVVNLLPQIGVGSDPGGPFEWFTLQEMPSLVELRAKGIGPAIHLRVWGCEAADAREVLVARGFKGDLPFEVLSDKVFAEPYSSIPTNVTGVIDQTTRRAIAKISVNYFAYHYPGLVRMPQFAEIRRYVRFGNSLAQNLVSVVRAAVVANIPEDAQEFTHVVTATWNSKLRSVVGQVSLFNWIQYRVALGEGFLVDQACVASGHHFDPFNEKIMAMTTKR